ncbi:MAG: hypothetical protein LBH22_01475 [Bacteroidales bacterium]|jgi:hypothetical protein|nr:hypothetical protein [Bacteroidales bacterium]
MKKKFFNLRNVVAIAICLAVTTMFSGCDKDPNGDQDGGETLNLKLVSRIDHYSEWSGLLSNEFQYDAQNRVIKIISTSESGEGKGTTTITYPTANTIVFHEESGSSETLTLNGDGSIVSTFGVTYAYDNGYLQKMTNTYNGNYTITYTWQNGNIKTVVMEEPSYPPYTTEYEYGTVQNKPASMDFWYIVEGDFMPRGWFGKSNANLPSKIISGGDSKPSDTKPTAKVYIENFRA